jgi:hypothetical protein
MSFASWGRPLSALCLLVLLSTIGSALSPARRPITPRDPRPAGYWFKGNTHTHTRQSDGDSTPDQVVEWYRNHDYDFLFLTDHDTLSDTNALNAAFGADHQFLVIQGEEVTDSIDGRPVHLNALDPSAPVTPQHGGSVLEVMQRNVDAIRRSGGVALLNHPNFVSPIGAEVLSGVTGTPLFELFNGHPDTNSFGSAGVPSMEAVWDRILSGGRLMYGVADDDAHTFQASAPPRRAGPGRGWVYVHAERLAAQPILAALERGDFYSSTGVELNSYQVSGRWITVDVHPEPSRTYRVQFIGQDGRVLADTTSLCATYERREDETYVRVRIEDSTGAFAWTQPVFGSLSG